MTHFIHQKRETVEILYVFLIRYLYWKVNVQQQNIKESYMLVFVFVYMCVWVSEWVKRIEDRKIKKWLSEIRNKYMAPKLQIENSNQLLQNRNI